MPTGQLYPKRLDQLIGALHVGRGAPAAPASRKVAITMGRRVCSEPGCPRIQDAKKCSEHAGQHNKRRGTKQERGYDRTHDALRAEWQARMDAGEVVWCTSPDCFTPSEPVRPDDWHLGHDGQRRHRGPEHPRCNLSAAGHASHRLA